MFESIPFGKIQKKFEAEFIALHSELESLAKLYSNLPVSDAGKKAYLEKTLKIKSAWYACLVNSNIDVLLLPEYLESRQSRNILIKKETEQYFQSLASFNLLTVQNAASIYDCILYSEEVEPKSSFDLFSSQAPESAKCPQNLKRLFEHWEKQTNGFSNLESMVYMFLDWHKLNGFNFSGQRQTVLWLNHQFWKMYGNVFQKMGFENFLYKKWNKEIFQADQAIGEMIAFIKEEVELQRLELRELYRNEIQFELLKSRQKLLSTYFFENQFNVDIPSGISVGADSILKRVQSKGYLRLSDFQDKQEAEKNLLFINELIELHVLIPAVDEDEVCLYFNTSLKNAKSRLFTFQNLINKERAVPISEFIAQSIVKPIVPIEKAVIPEPASEVLVQKRQKAFFG